jgi:hypothetical protein
MFKKLFKRHNDARGGPAFGDTASASRMTMEERRAAHRPLRVPEVAHCTGVVPSDAHPNFIAIYQAFPHIGNKLKAYWGCQEFVSYMRNLIHDTRGGTRQGFPWDVLVALQSLLDEHFRAYPHILPKDRLWA